MRYSGRETSFLLPVLSEEGFHRSVIGPLDLGLEVAGDHLVLGTVVGDALAAGTAPFAGGVGARALIGVCLLNALHNFLQALLLRWVSRVRIRDQALPDKIWSRGTLP
jgi:hypothetical protein